MKSRMIFHHPFPIPSTPISGSAVRVSSIASAFDELGYKVERVVGYLRERKKAIERVRSMVARGERFDFVYSECSAGPATLAKRNILQPLLDFGFFRWCRKNSIPVGLFFRDVYWRFDFYKKRVPLVRRALTTPLYWLDWVTYLQAVDHLFLPSLAMEAVLPTPWPSGRMSALPPGCQPSAALAPTDGQSFSNALELFYVGGVVPPVYDMTPMTQCVNCLESVRLTLCCRPREWAAVKHQYGSLDPGKVRVVHAQGSDLAGYYAAAHLFALARRPTPYMQYTIPVKVFEALSHCLPIVATKGTVAAEFVAAEGIGWVVADSDELATLLMHLKAHPEMIAEKRRRMAAIRDRHTWSARARTAADVLTGIAT